MSTAVHGTSSVKLLKPKRTSAQRQECRARKAGFETKLLEQQKNFNNAVMELAEEFEKYVFPSPRIWMFLNVHRTPQFIATQLFAGSELMRTKRAPSLYNAKVMQMAQEQRENGELR